tara:strand:+ start:250 stop:546 length:297 start_codon:yes stop_codon:yes gene_type:complete
MKNKNIKYILKDSLNTHISMHDTHDEVMKILTELNTKIFKNDTWSIFGGTFDDLPCLEDNALFRIPKDIRENYSDNKFINFYFFKFDLNTNKRLDLYK